MFVAIRLIIQMGSRHYSDRLCSDRRYSDIPQSGRPSTSLACLSICRNSRNWDKIGGGRGVACIESTSLIQAPIDRGDRGEWGLGSGKGIPVRSEVPPPPEKLQRTSKAPAQLYCPLLLIFGISPDFRDFVRRISNRYCPQAYSTAVSHPMSTSRLWTIGIMSVGTESVGIAW